jgi:hypothetical protein
VFENRRTKESPKQEQQKSKGTTRQIVQNSDIGLIEVEIPDVITECVVFQAIRQKLALETIEGNTTSEERVDSLLKPPECDQNPWIASKRIQMQINDYGRSELASSSLGNIRLSSNGSL